MPSRNDRGSPSRHFLPKSEMRALIVIGIVLIISLVCRNAVIEYYLTNGDFFYNLSLGILSWSSIQSASLLAIHLHVRNDLERLEDSKKNTALKILYKNNKKIFKDYTNSLFRGWIASLVLAMTSLCLIVLQPSISFFGVYLAGAFMFSLFVGLFFLLYFILIIYRSISSFK